MAPTSALDPAAFVMVSATVAPVPCWRMIPLAVVFTVAVEAAPVVSITPKKQGLPGGVARSHMVTVSLVVLAPG
jgi:hypothetical protein